MKKNNVKFARLVGAIFAAAITFVWIVDRDIFSQFLIGKSDGSDESNEGFPESKHKGSSPLRVRNPGRVAPRASGEKIFTSLSIDEMGASLSKRIEMLRKGGLNDPKFVSDILRDINDFTPFGGEVYQGYFTSILINEIDIANGVDLEKFLGLHAHIAEELEKQSWGKLSAEETLVSQLVSHAFRKKYNLIEELKKSSSTVEDRKLFLRSLAQSIVFYQDSHEEQYSELSAVEIQDVEQDVLKLSSARGNYVLPALDLYLSGGGETGVQRELVKGWMADRRGFLDNSKQIEEIIGQAPRGARRDTFIAEMVSMINGLGEYEVALQWVAEIDDKTIVDEVRKKFKSE